MSEEKMMLFIIILVVGVTLLVLFFGFIFWLEYGVKRKNPELYAKLCNPTGADQRSKFQREQDNVLKTRYIKDDYRGVRETVSTSSAISRSLVGGAIGGDLGAIIGAGTARTKTVGQPKAVFIVWYKDGTDAVKTVKMNSKYYDLYLSKLER